MSRSSARIPNWAQELLDAGEHPLIEYKGIRIPDDFPHVVAFGANTAALRGQDEEFIILLGVAEQKDNTGRRRGEAVGLRDEDGAVIRDLGWVENKVKNLVNNNVIPNPLLDFDFVNTTGRYPFVVVRIKSTTPPYRAADRYGKRSGSHSVSLGTDELLLLLRPQWAGALEVMTEDTPLSKKLDAMSLDFEILRRNMLEDDWRGERIEERLGELQAALTSVAEASDVEQALSDLEEAIRGDIGAGERDTIGDAIARVAERLAVTTQEEALSEVVRQRRNSWLALTREEIWQELAPDVLSQGKAMFEAFFFSTPRLEDYAKNVSECEGWSLGWEDYKERSLKERGRKILFSASFAATAMSERLMWDEYLARSVAELEREDLMTLLLRTDAKGASGASILGDRRGRQPEAAILNVETKAARELFASSAALSSDPSGAIIELRMREDMVRIGFPPAAGPLVVTCRPTLVSASRPDAATELRSWRKRLRTVTGLQPVQLSNVTGGLLGILGGQRYTSK